MALQITRWLIALLNLLLGSALAVFWWDELLGRILNDRIGWSVFLWSAVKTSGLPGGMILLAVLAATIASTGAALLLARQQTTRTGLHWHNSVSLCGVVFSAALVGDSGDFGYLIHHTEIWFPLITLFSVTLIWPVMGGLLGALLRHGDRRQINRAHSATAPALLPEDRQEVEPMPIPVTRQNDDAIVLRRRA